MHDETSVTASLRPPGAICSRTRTVRAMRSSARDHLRDLDEGVAPPAPPEPRVGGAPAEAEAEAEPGQGDAAAAAAAVTPPPSSARPARPRRRGGAVGPAVDELKTSVLPAPVRAGALGAGAGGGGTAASGCIRFPSP